MSGNGSESALSAPGLCAADVRRLARNPGKRTEVACARAAATRWCTDQGLLAAALASEMLGLVSGGAALGLTALDPVLELGASAA